DGWPGPSGPNDPKPRTGGQSEANLIDNPPTSSLTEALANSAKQAQTGKDTNWKASEPVSRERGEGEASIQPEGDGWSRGERGGGGVGLALEQESETPLNQVSKTKSGTSMTRDEDLISTREAARMLGSEDLGVVRQLVRGGLLHP